MLFAMLRTFIILLFTTGLVVQSKETVARSGATYAKCQRADGTQNTLGTTSGYKQFKTSLFAYTTNGLSLADGNSTVFDSSLSNTVDNDDVIKISNFGENCGLLKGSYTLALDARQPLADKDTIFLRVWNTKQQQYQFRFVPSDINRTGLTAELQDNFTNINTPISTTDTSYIDFTVTSNAASQSQTRFRIVFKVTSILPLDFIDFKAAILGNNAALQWTVANQNGIVRYDIEHSANGASFTKVGEVRPSEQGNCTCSFTHKLLVKGGNFYRIKAIRFSGTSSFSSIIRLNNGTSNPAMSIAPNPVQGQRLMLTLTDQLAGTYVFSMFNNAGQPIFSQTIVHEGGSNAKSLNLPTGLSTGIYNILVTSPGGTIVTKRIIINH